ncbi:hypothetical protein [Leminorella grimontii]|uniref:hypothetical protein n=1 Tax=Leminorella grimontii TaxID=82981 RepID=UPI002086A701|nr:hypothetical protein [Leminorella grimontii]GKX60935.1 hypothetical protein SOASR031_32500 [Leminorella grimontii]
METEWYSERNQRELNLIYPNIADNMKMLPELDKSTIQDVIAFLLALFESSHVENICYARRQLWQISPSWLEAHFLPVVETLSCLGLFDYEDDWLYRRLLEAIAHSPALLEQAIVRGEGALNLEVLEAAEDFRRYLPNGTNYFVAFLAQEDLERGK